MIKKCLIIILCIVWIPTIFASKNLLILGDSLSAAHGIDVKQGWVNLLQEKITEQKLDYTVINASISGDTSSGALLRLPELLQQHKPTIVIVEIGGNDGLRGTTLNIIKSNLTRIITTIDKSGAKILLLGIRLPPNYGETYTEKFHQLYATLADEYSLAHVPFMLEGILGHPDFLQADGIHPTAQAQTLILNNIWPILLPLLRSQ